QLAGQRGQPLQVPLGVPILDDDIRSRRPAQFTESCFEPVALMKGIVRGWLAGRGERTPTRGTLPGVCCASAKGVRRRPTARTTASLIKRMRTSWRGKAGRESNRPELWAMGSLQALNLSFFRGCVQYLYLSFSLFSLSCLARSLSDRGGRT